MNDAETFTRVIYFAIAHLNLSMIETLEMPFGLLSDLIECHLQWSGVTKAADEAETLDDIIPMGIE